MAKQTYFDQSWLSDSRYSKYCPWLESCDDRTSFRCRLCVKTIKLSNIGITAVKSHSEIRKHVRLAALQSGVDTSIASFFHPSQSSSELLLPVPETGPVVQPNQPVATSTTTGSSEAGTSNYLTKLPASRAKVPFFSSDEDRIRAEIYWLLHMVHSHSSFNSAARISDLFRMMFSDSTIAQHFQMADDKARYVAVYGLAPYFAQQLAGSV